MTTNRKANFNYNFEDFIEAGIVLKGSEIKSIRESKIDISNAFCRIQGNEVWLHNAHIAQYSNINFQSDYDPIRSRKLLLNKREINKWDLEIKKKNLIIIPLKIFFKNGRAKINIGIGKSKKKFDKRETIRKREEMRDIERTRKANK
ncbi:MAG: SsrA-binding protein SmpB [Chloroflexi bacterium]|nr:SsrA-binding protein SmpB [Chloroflexota bacterium]|tara:strand:- start:277 stop:717 length:441 start_codon:yes stop_codon:yes gene_type:complete